MRKTKILFVGLIVASAAYVGYSVQKDMQESSLLESDYYLSDVEAMADNESGGSTVYVTCRCSDVTDQSCAANNKSSICAGGENVNCSQYNTNCAKQL